MTDYGVISNLVVCSLVVIFSVFYEYRLRRLLEKQPQEIQDRSRFQLWALSFWTLAWVAWLSLYLVRIATGHVSPPVDLACNDAHSLFLLACFFSLSRGSDLTEMHTPMQVFRAFACVAALLALLDTCLVLAADSIIGDMSSTLFWRYSSVCLAMVAPFMLGRACVKRFGSKSIWAVGIAYAMLQPLAYGITFFPLEHREVHVCINLGKIGHEVPDRWMDAEKGCLCRLSGPNGLISCQEYGHGVYTVKDPEKMSDGLVADLLAASERHQYLSAWFKLKFRSVLFGILAAMKLLFSALFFQHLQRVAPSSQTTVSEFSEAKWTSLDNDGRKLIFFSQIGLMIVVVVLGVSFYCDVALVVCWGGMMACVGLLLKLTGKKWHDIVGVRSK